MKNVRPLLPWGVALSLSLASTLLGSQDSFVWEVHDPARPLAEIVQPGQNSGPPSDALVLIGNDSDGAAWRSGEARMAWDLKQGILTVTPGSGSLTTRAEFGDCQVHLEWRVPADREVNGQSGANSGVFFMERYELQILQSHGNVSYADGMAGSIYGQYPPLVNPCRPAGEWNSYDVVFRAPRFDQAGELLQPAFITAHFNGVLIQDSTRVLGPTRHKLRTIYSAHAAKGPIALQDHGDPISFRNIWVRDLEPRRGPE